jgi:hypothetical protein
MGQAATMEIDLGNRRCDVGGQCRNRGREARGMRFAGIVEAHRIRRCAGFRCSDGGRGIYLPEYIFR